MPLGTVRNRRSLVAIDNLVDLLIRCTAHPGAAGQTFLVSDGEDLSTTALLERMAASMGCRARLLPVPPELLAWLLRLLGRQSTAQSLLASLQIDIAKTRALLDWAPHSRHLIRDMTDPNRRASPVGLRWSGVRFRVETDGPGKSREATVI